MLEHVYKIYDNGCMSTEYKKKKIFLFVHLRLVHDKREFGRKRIIPNCEKFNLVRDRRASC